MQSDEENEYNIGNLPMQTALGIFSPARENPRDSETFTDNADSPAKIITLADHYKIKGKKRAKKGGAK